MSARKEYIGKRFGRLTPIREAEPKIRIRKDGSAAKMLRFVCRCDCGTETMVLSQDLQSGNSRSCGCSFHEPKNVTHGMSISKRRGGKATTEYHSWQGMLGRCKNPKHISYKYYGAKGIVVCERWQSFENFIADMGMKPTPKHSIDRIDANGDYCPENCRWATPKEQFANLKPSPEFLFHMYKGK